VAFRKLLVANRGEIAARVIRSARALGYPTVAVYSDADRDAPHVALADEAVRIGPPPARSSYLDAQALLAACDRTGADAVHPGYGFLAENAEFAAACAWAGRVFVGPPPEAIELMGDKARAKARMEEAGVPVVPGYRGDPSDDALRAAAADVGFPLLVKAAAGGGGRGMRRVDDPAELPEALASARREATSAFGSGDLLLERLVERARHVEVQVFADQAGGALHLGERDCSVQRRFQKVVEEAPSPAVDADLRTRMGEAAVAAARAIGYVGAGTVELLLGPDGEFYFLEMNTRLQVEHPVTEEVTGLDLVALQLRIAAGEPLPFPQEEVRLEGHAIEVRLYAEDPYAGHAPQTGPVLAWAPAAGPGLRCDHGLRAGQEVTAHYDPMIGKLVARGRDREEARRRLVLALRRTALLGFATNKRFLGAVLEHPTFVQGEAWTGFLDSAEGAGLAERPEPAPRLLALGAALFAPHLEREAGGWRTTGPAPFPIVLLTGADRVPAAVTPTGGGAATVTLPDGEHAVRLLGVAGHERRVEVDGVQETAFAAWDPDGRLHLELGGEAAILAEELPKGAAAAEAATGTLAAPSSGSVTAVAVEAGQRVEPGQHALTLEAMKIESKLLCDVAGVVAEVRVEPGAQVKQRQVLVVIEPDPGDGGSASRD